MVNILKPLRFCAQCSMQKRIFVGCFINETHSEGEMNEEGNENGRFYDIP